MRMRSKRQPLESLQCASSQRATQSRISRCISRRMLLKAHAVLLCDKKGACCDKSCAATAAIHIAVVVRTKAHAVTSLARQLRPPAPLPDTPARDLAAEKRAKVSCLCVGMLILCAMYVSSYYFMCVCIMGEQGEEAPEQRQR